MNKASDKVSNASSKARQILFPPFQIILLFTLTYHTGLSAMVQYFFSQNKTAIDGLSAAETISQTTHIRCFGFSKFIAFAMHLDIYLIETKLDFL
jgi:hypothetical protein